jgi:anion-transporting  ArsA/GET3 family ATPase
LTPARLAKSVPARLSIFLGKGGVGRTTLSCAFAVDRAAAGERVLLVSVVSGDDPLQRIEHEAAGVDTGGRLKIVHIDSRALVDEAVRRLTRMPALAEFIVRQPGYESLVDIAPGVREMAILHFIGAKRDEGFDRIVIDAPATGHGIHFLEAPEKTAKILAGPLRERAEALRDMLKDPAQTDVVIVTVAEEMPVRETMELAAKLRQEGFPLDNVVVNRWLPRVFEDPASRRVLDKVIAEHRAAPDWLDALCLVATQRAEGDSHLAELRSIPAKLAVVPLIPDSSRRLLKVAEAMKDFARAGAVA